MNAAAPDGGPLAVGLPAQRPFEGPASVLVAQGFTPDAMPLGLDAALPLCGGGDRIRRRLTADLGFGWQSSLRGVIDRAVSRQEATGADWLTLPPLMLSGPAGVGRTHVARRIASLAELPHVGVTVGGAFGIEQLRPTACGPDLILPSAPVLAMAVSRCANPIVSVCGIDDLDAAGQTDLARMINPATAERWVDYACGATVDLRHVNWMIQVQEPAALTPTLLRLLEPVPLRFPEDQDVPLHLVEILAEAAVDRGVVDRVGGLAEDGLAYLARLRGERSVARIYADACQWLDAQFER